MCCPLTFNGIHCSLLGLQESVDNLRDNKAPNDRHTTSNEWVNDAKGNGTDMVRWYIFDICTILISLRINLLATDFFFKF